MNLHIDPAEFREVINEAVSASARHSKEERQTDELGRIAVDREGLTKIVPVSVSTIDRWKRNEGLPYVRLDNGKPIFILESVAAWLKSREIIATPKEGGAE